MPAPEIIHQLVSRFTDNRDAYHSGKYNEAQLRQEFLDKFFEALGWDIYNKNDFSPEYRDVVIEDSLEIEGTAKAPDYAFKIGKERKFYVEAKKPAVDIKYDIHPAYQLRRYAWNAHLPLSILTDFEEFAVYNCKNKPNPGDSAATGRDLFFHYTDYIEKWDEIASIFSRDAVWKGSFDRFADTSKGKKGTTEVDDAFLEDIEKWRTSLARNIALRNPQVTDEHQLNYAVQMTIDRIIFLRICEDRAMEPENQLLELTHLQGIYTHLFEVFQRADVKYNSGLFHFNHERGQTSPSDTFTPGLKIDDKVLKEIILSMYYPCPYIFKEIPVEILGQVYEQFLGKVIRLTPGHIAKIEEKPEVRKAGGVYYTPRYIVDYIVQNTVGKLLEGKAPDEAATLKIVDPACGSGSFLLGAYQHLLDWHINWYTQNEPDKWAKGKNPAIIPANGGGWKLTTQKKKEILVNNIHGVDIDAQAVEVTKLSLLLKVLEEESGQLSLGLERALPDLSRNIQCGNSLIGEDYFAGRLVVDEEERRRVNPFEWQHAFPQVFARGGFDAVIGNPPYIRIQTMKEWAPQDVTFYKRRYKSARTGNYDIYVIFIEMGFSLLNESGRLGFILPHKFFNAQYGEAIRELIFNKVSKIVYFGFQQVFENATTYTCLLFLENHDQENFEYFEVIDIGKWISGFKNSIFLPTKNINRGVWVFGNRITNNFYEKLSEIEPKLETVTERIFQGVKTSADKIFIVDEIEQNDEIVKIFSPEKEKEFLIEKELLHPLVKGGNSKRYKLLPSSKLLIFPYKFINSEKYKLISKQEFKDRYPRAWAYLLENKSILEHRENGKMIGNEWYAYIYPKNFNVMVKPKIFTPDLANVSSFSIDETGEVFFTGGVAGGYGILPSPLVSRYYLLGLLNSKLLQWYLRQYSTMMRGGWFSYESRFIRDLPIKLLNNSNLADAKQQELLIELVKLMLDLNKRTPATPQEQESLQRHITATDRQIDQLVYQLYGLTDEEIKIVEG